MTLRQRGFAAEIVMIGDEAAPPYERPPLSKSYLTGDTPREKLLLQPEERWREQGVEWRGRTRAVAIDRARHQLELQDRDEIGYSTLVLATGSQPNHLLVPGAQLPGVMTLGNLEDADGLLAKLAARPRVVVVGGGFLGCELAAAARELGCEVTILEMGRALLPGLGEEAGSQALRLQQQHGATVRLGTTVTKVVGGPTVGAVELGDGSAIACELVLACIGSRPRVELAAASGLRAGSGIQVDGTCRTSDPAIYAAGDVASFWHPALRRRVRLEHWDNAQRQGAHAAQAILGSQQKYRPTPYFWSEQYDYLIQQVGFARPGQERVLRGIPDSGSFSVLYLQGRRVAACLAVNRYPDLAAARRLIDSNAMVNPEVLRDPEADLRAISMGTVS